MIKTIYFFAGQTQTILIPENEDGTMGNPWVRDSKLNLWEVVGEILKQGGQEKVSVIPLTQVFKGQG